MVLTVKMNTIRSRYPVGPLEMAEFLINPFAVWRRSQIRQSNGFLIRFPYPGWVQKWANSG